MDKLYAGSSPIGVLSELLLAGLNGNSHVYHVSPVFTMMEIHVTRALARLYGFNGERAGGLSCPGGSASNQLAMVTARNSLYPEIKKLGYFPRPSIQQQREMEEHGYSFIGVKMSTYGKLIAFTSSAGHYSLEKSAVMMGLGTENIVSVPCDSYGSMIPSELGKRLLYRKGQSTPTMAHFKDTIASVSYLLVDYNSANHCVCSFTHTLPHSFNCRTIDSGTHRIGTHALLRQCDSRNNRPGSI